MRFTYPKQDRHEETAETLNPALLYSKDIQAYAVAKEYRQALRTHQASKVQKIREANTDLLPYLRHIDIEAKKNPYYEV